MLPSKDFILFTFILTFVVSVLWYFYFPCDQHVFHTLELSYLFILYFLLIDLEEPAMWISAMLKMWMLELMESQSGWRLFIMSSRNKVTTSVSSSLVNNTNFCCLNDIIMILYDTNISSSLFYFFTTLYANNSENNKIRSNLNYVVQSINQFSSFKLAELRY